MAKWLDKDGTSYLWGKIKSNFASKSDAIKNITRSGTTFTATRADNTTFTFTQQDNNTNTTYTLTQDSSDGHKITLTPSSGSATTITIPDNNTWRGIQDNLTSSTNTTESLSAKQGYLLANGSARDDTKLPLSGGTLTGNLIIKKTTAATNTYDDANPKLIFQNSGASQNISLTFTDYDSVQFPASLTLNGNQGGEYFIAPNIKTTSNIIIAGTIKIANHVTQQYNTATQALDFIFS